ncbi:hypothetical protein RB614_27125 [Phytohabitans sp. ZYX-F-186]|uniref:O-antigen polysaccharide polymerase Wzy n=1 Tax=Phytohabitans maris TaxID=3071409 RepID=A0ABU0ZME2_9ACTN|nr:hypothetical protein [Phytohabitans sp. ZYX-F-186]MDQ7908203.1 hypothetical protein [Phytohabitans sp. ZYX-F-186]
MSETVTRSEPLVRVPSWLRRPSSGGPHPITANLPVAAAWYAVGVVGLLLGIGDPAQAHERPILVLSCASLLFGLWVFWRHGGTRLTGIGIYNYAFALFVGFAGLHLLYFVDYAAEGSLMRALAWCYFGHVTTWLLFWSGRSERPGTSERPARAERPGTSEGPAGTEQPHGTERRGRAARPSVDPVPAVPWGVTWIGLALVVGAALASLKLDGSARHLGQAAGFVGAVLAATGLLRDLRRPPLIGCLVAAGGFLVAFATSNSFARLTLGSLGLALTFVVAQRLRTPLVKLAVVLGSAPMLFTFGVMRKEAVREAVPGVYVASSTGLESVASPLRDFGVLLDYYHAGLIEPHWGYTFWVAVVSLVPRSLWPGKPDGFGAELTKLLNPGLAQSGHSDAALFQGEWLFNFGIAGLILMIPVVGLAVRAVDSFLEWSTRRPLASRHALLACTTAIIVAAGLPDLMWVGTFTFAVRAGMRLLVLFAVWFLIFDRKAPAVAFGRRAPATVFDRRGP